MLFLVSLAARAIRLHGTNPTPPVVAHVSSGTLPIIGSHMILVLAHTARLMIIDILLVSLSVLPGDKP